MRNRIFNPFFKLFLVGAFCATNMFAWGQTTDKWLDKAAAEFEQKNYPKAIEYYEWASRTDQGAESWIGLGMSYRSISDYANAAKSFSRAVEAVGVNPETYFYHGHALLSIGKKDEAREWFRRYAEEVPESDRAISLENLEQLTSRPALDSSEFQFNLASFNSENSDFSPAICNEDLYFCSARKSSTSLLTYTSTVDNAPLIDLFKVEGYFDSSQTKTQIEPVKSLNTPVNEGPMCFGADGNIIYFTRNNPEQLQSRRSNQRLNKLRLFKSVRQGESWSQPQDLPFNSSEYANGHPALSPDERYLYFASDRPGGYGGTDLYRVEILGDEFGTPENLGSRINGSGDEMFPFISAEGVLHFASDGILGFGGLDLYKSVLQETGWSRPVNLGLPLNSNADDFGMVLVDGTQQGFFSSNRNRKPENDEVYQFGFLRPRFTCQPQQEDSYCYELVEEGSFDLEADTTATDTSPMIYQWNFGDGEKAIGLKVQHCFPGPGTYLVQLNLIDTVSDFVFLNEATYELEIPEIEQVYITAPDTVPSNQEIVMDGKSSVLPDCDVRKYYWESSDGRKSTGSSWIISFPDPGTYMIRLGVDGYQKGQAVPCRTCSSKEIVVLSPQQYTPPKPQVEKQKDPELERWLEFSDSLSRLKPVLETKGQKNEKGGSTSKVYDFPPMYSAPPGSTPKQDPPNSIDESIVLPVLPKGHIANQKPLEFVRVPVRLQGDLAYIRPNADNPKEIPIPVSQLRNGLVLEKDISEDSKGYTLAYMDRKDLAQLDSCVGCMPVSYYTKGDGAQQNEVLIEEEIRLEKLVDLIDKGVPVRINNLHFDFDSYEIRPESRQTLFSIARVIDEAKPGKIILYGHTDNIGSDNYNLKLSKLRALAVSQFFILQGYTDFDIEAEGQGESRPVAPNTTKEGRFLNRRVEFLLESPGKAPKK